MSIKLRLEVGIIVCNFGDRRIKGFEVVVILSL